MSERGATASRNGAHGAALASFAVSRDVPYDDPMDKVLGLDAKTSSLAAWLGFSSGGTALAAALLALASVVAWMHTAKAAAADRPEEVEVLRDDPPPPPPPPEATQEPEAKVAPPPRAAAAAPPPPSPAQAAKVLTQEPDPNDPVDLTGNTIVQGNADAYAGGFTAANGTNTSAAKTMPVASGVAGGTGPVQQAAPPAVDHSRNASLLGGGEWSCPFPPEADSAQVDDAYVTLQIDVTPEGTPSAARVVADPGNGFGREARRCAMNRRYTTALDHDGTAIAGSIKTRVHFSR